MRLTRLAASLPSLLFVACLLALSVGAARTTGPADPSPSTTLIVTPAVPSCSTPADPECEGEPAPLVGDDNDDGTIDEQESGWDCLTMGNQVCGPGAPEWMRDGDPTTGEPAP